MARTRPATLAGILPRTSALASALLLYHFAPMEAAIGGLPYTASLSGLTLPVMGLAILAFAEVPHRGSEWSGEFRWPLILIQIVFCFHYVNAGLAKLHWTGLAWYSPRNFGEIAVTLWTINHQPLGMTVYRTPWLATALGVATFLLEFGFPLVLFSKWARRIILPAALIAAILRIYVFGFFFLSLPCLLIMINWDAVARWWESRTRPVRLPEHELLIDLAAGPGDASRRERIRRLALAKVDWRVVIEAAQEHGVLQFIQPTLRDAGIDIPSPFDAIVTQQSGRNTARALMHHRELQRIVSALREHGISSTTYKGTALSLQLYGRRDIRTSADIDLLVSSTDALRAIEIATTLGYTRAYRSADEATLLRLGKEAVLKNETAHCSIDLQWRAFPLNEACRLDSAAASLHTIPLTAEPTLAAVVPEELFLLLAHHGLKHEWGLLKWIRDIDAFCRNVTTDWSQVANQCAKAGLERSVGIALAVAERVFASPVPGELRGLTTDPTVRRMTAQIEKALFEPRRSAPLTELLFQLKARRHWSDRLRFIRFVCTPKPWDQEEQPFQLPKLLKPFLRPLQLLFRDRSAQSQIHEVQKVPGLQNGH